MELLRPPQFQQCFGQLRHLFQHHIHLGTLSIVFQRIRQNFPAGLFHGFGLNGDLDARSQSLHI